ncbi:Tsc3p Ecym_2649 [Eremothecium cymbalariae DBVPG|uniref:Uncharacterized protein n=1 Tax=Eremothecium cymbalariae (strain CBS 270.75 / DBVPG 7215 / KCTC 17166 / NRRL Y-17582) TaxID=931890 RepID=G8JNT5_ERECY|nr:Hypothetical protein Ecym_2649 [Eremothecium cymbalariae DBVPG\
MVTTEKIYEPYKKARGTMVYAPTNAQKSKGGFIERVSNSIENLYWMYYIHLPYYLMTNFDSFCLHTMFLIIFTLSLFGLGKWISSIYWFWAIKWDISSPFYTNT